MACGPAAPPATPISRGTASDGWLQNGQALPESGAGYVRARPGESTRFGMPRLIATIEHAAATVDQRFPGTPPLRVGDLSYRFGGRHPRHGSHRSGRDVDLIFYATDIEGNAIRGRGWVAYDRFGVGVEPEEHGGSAVLFDLRRNWHLVRALVLHPAAQVQWIFVSAGLKSLLLKYAAEHEPNREAIYRATWVLHQPYRGNPHADHFHVRLACGREQRALGCIDYGPVWPWLRNDATKQHQAQPDSDATLVDALLEARGTADELATSELRNEPD